MMAKASSIYLFIRIFAPQKHNMKAFGYVLALGAIILMGACTPNHTMPADWMAVDSLCAKDPEQAIGRLEQLALQVNPDNEWAWHRWQLLRIKAQDKADRPLASDSIIKKVVAYFDRHGSVKERIEAYYYLGRTYHELHDSPRAVTAYLTPDVLILRNCCSQLSIVYRLQHNAREAVNIALKSYKIVSRHNVLGPIDAMDIATGYWYLGITDSTEYYYKEAMQKIYHERTEERYADIIGEILEFYAIAHKKEESDIYLHILDSISEKPYNYIPSKASYFEAFGPIDSAIFYNKTGLQDTTDLEAVHDASRSLVELYKSKGDLENSCYYAHVYTCVNESINRRLTLEQARDANNIFKYRRDMEAEAEAYRQATAAKQQKVAAVMASIFILMLVSIVYLYRQQKMERKLRRHEAQIRHQTATIQQQELHLEEQAATLRYKDMALDKQEKEIEKTRRKIAQKDKEILIREKTVNQLNRRIVNRSAAAVNREIITYFQHQAAAAAPVHIEQYKWDELQDLIGKMYPKLMKAVWQHYPSVKPEELHIICLLKSGFDITAILRMTSLSRTSVYRMAKEAREVLGDLLDGSLQR